MGVRQSNGTYIPQAITNAANAAYVTFGWYGHTAVIADHAYQGFSAIEGAGTLTFAGRTYTKVSQYYTDSSLNVNGTYGPMLQDGTLCTYTCSGSGRYIAFWN